MWKTEWVKDESNYNIIEGHSIVLKGIPNELLATQIARDHNRVEAMDPDFVADPIEKTQMLMSLLDHLHQAFYAHLSAMNEHMSSRKFTKEDLCDFGFLCRESEKLLDDWRKDCKARKELAGKILSAEVLQATLNDDTVDDIVRGKLARGKCDCRQEAALPKRGTPDYEELLDFFYVPRKAIGDGVLRLDWKKVGELATECAEEGKPLPPGLGKTYTVFQTIFTRLTTR